MSIPPPPQLVASVSDIILENEWDTIRVMEDILRGTQGTSVDAEMNVCDIDSLCSGQTENSVSSGKSLSLSSLSIDGIDISSAKLPGQISKKKGQQPVIHFLRAPDQMENHNNTLNQAPRGRQKKRLIEDVATETTDHNQRKNDLICDADLKKSRAFENTQSQIRFPATHGKVAFPKILKRDLRRVFGQMYLNVLNSGDPILFARFMRQYVNYNAQYQRYLAPSSSSSTQSANSNSVGKQSHDIPLIVGRDAIMYFLASHHETAPDTITMCQEGSIRQHLNSSESEIVLQVKMAGTRLYMIEWQELLQLMTSLQLQPNQSPITPNPSVTSNSSDAANTSAESTEASNTSSFLDQFRRSQQLSLQSLFPQFPASSDELTELALLHFTDRMKRVMLTSPTKFEMEGTFTLYLDECFNVYRFDFARHSLQFEKIPELSRENNDKSSENSSGQSDSRHNDKDQEIRHGSMAPSAHWISNP